jgi:hypothetical protein
MSTPRALSHLATLCALTAACRGHDITHHSVPPGSPAGAGGGPDCASFDNGPVTAMLPIEIVNGTDHDVFLGHPCGSTALYQIEPPSGQGELTADVAYCDPSCAELQTTPPMGCLAICLATRFVELVPGAAYDTSWNRLVRFTETMPANCLSAPSATSADSVQCPRYVTAELGKYTVSAYAWREVRCGDADPASCEPDASGRCEIDACSVVGTRLEGSASFQLDAGTVTVTIH